MSQNTDPFPTPRGALSPEGVSARVPRPPTPRKPSLQPLTEAEGREADRILAAHLPDPLGVPGYAGAKGAVPEPQGPTTAPEPGPDGEWETLNEADRRKRVTFHAYMIGFEHGQAEARAAAPPDIDVELRSIVSDLAAIGHRPWRDEADVIAGNNAIAALMDRADAVLIASPDATPETYHTGGRFG